MAQHLTGVGGGAAESEDTIIGEPDNPEGDLETLLDPASSGYETRDPHEVSIQFKNTFPIGKEFESRDAMMEAINKFATDNLFTVKLQGYNNVCILTLNCNYYYRR